MRYPKLRELREALRAIIKGPYTSSFPYAPHEPYEKFRGFPHFNPDYCMGCTACVQVCPAGALKFIDEEEGGKAKRVVTVLWERCICCGQCEANCPAVKGIVLSREFEMSTTEKREELLENIERELVLCDCCHKTVAPRDQLLWVASRIGPLCFSNASLMLFFLETLGLGLKKGRKAQEGSEPDRSDRIRVLCPACRREAVLKS